MKYYQIEFVPVTWAAVHAHSRIADHALAGRALLWTRAGAPAEAKFITITVIIVCFLTCVTSPAMLTASGTPRTKEVFRIVVLGIQLSVEDDGLPVYCIQEAQRLIFLNAD